MAHLWVLIEAGLNDILHSNPISPDRHNELLNAIHQYCKYSIHPIGQDLISNKDFNELSERVNNLFEVYLKSLHCKMSKEENVVNIVKIYHEKFKSFKTSLRKYNAYFNYMNDRRFDIQYRACCTWIRPIHWQGLVCWEEHMLIPFSEQLPAIVFSQIEMERLGNSADPEIIKNVIGVYKEKHEDFEPFLQVYKGEFEARYIENTKELYAAESAAFLKSHTITEYLTLAERRLAEECTRAQSYFHPSTLQPLKAACQDVLILGHMELLKLEFAKMVLECQHENVAQMLRILGDHPDQYAEMCQILKNVVETEGQTILEKNKERALKDVKVYFSLIHNVLEKFRSLVEKATNNETRIFEASELAYRSLINSNPITLTHKSSDINASFLAQYSDSMLNQTSKNEEDIEKRSDKVLSILPFLENVDIFIAHYLDLMTKRLLLNNSLGHGLEANLLAKLKGQLGGNITSRLERMLADYQGSKELKEPFNRFQENRIHPLRPYLLQSSSIQMIIILQFNDVLSFSVEQLQQRTEIKMEYLLRVLETLLKTKVLTCEGKLNRSSTVRLNTRFSNKKSRPNINLPLPKPEKEAEKPVHLQVQRERKILVDSNIVRIMKGKKKLGHQQLVLEVISSLSSRFKVDIKFIKSCVEDLILKEYLERDDEKEAYKYVA
ncbi:CUL1 [Cordylochernes scorpioides]|uniref:CUL1 n=1 Tax=Cordylochernes scorpioides TaxID=51811 RepID=A0ABY6L1E8_9ARAC|nr:CUL1 [Cordylochernes scorpioides]